MINKQGDIPEGKQGEISKTHDFFTLDISNHLQAFFSPEVTKLLGVFFSHVRELNEIKDKKQQGEKVLFVSKIATQLKQTLSQGEYENEEIKSIMRQIEHVINPVANLHSLVGIKGLEELVRKRIEDEIDDELRAIQYAYELIGGNIDNLQRLSNNTLYIGQEEVISQGRKAIKDTDLKFEVNGNTQRKIHAPYFSVILQNIVSNYDKYGNKGEIEIHFGLDSFEVRTRNENKKGEDTKGVYSGGDGFEILKHVLTELGGKVDIQQDIDTFSLSLSGLQYKKEA